MTEPVKSLAEQLAALLATSSAQDVLAALVKTASAADVKAALKKAEAEKPTLLSLTMDAIVRASCAGQVITDNVVKDVTTTARAAGVLTETEHATASSVGALIRYANAFELALKRAGFETVKSTPAEPEAPAIDASQTDGAGNPLLTPQTEPEPEVPPVVASIEADKRNRRTNGAQA